MQNEFRSVIAIGILALLPAIALKAQQTGTITGTITDQVGKAIPNAAVEVRNDLTGASRTAVSDDNGKFSVPDLPVGTYSIVVSSPGFALTTRSGGNIAAGATLDVTIPMSVQTLTTSVTVNETILMAAATAPSGNTLEAVSAKTEVNGDFIRNFMSPLADYSEYINLAPGTFSLNPNGIGLGQGSTYYRGFQDGQYTMTFDGIPFEDTNTPTHHSWANFPSGWTSWLPNIAARYYIKSSWSAYAQFAEGSVIPPSAVFDTPNAQVLVPPKPTLAKTYQIGNVLKHSRWTLDADAYYIHFQNGFDSYLDPVSAEDVFVATGPSNTKGIEAESNIILGWGLSVYLNGTMGSAKYQTGPNFPNGGLWVANTPKNVESLALLWRHKNWDVGFIDKRVGTLYNDNGSLSYLINGASIPYPVDQAITINPFSVLNVFVNYTIKNQSFLRGSKLGLAVNNLADSHNVVGITPATAATSTVAFAPNPGDLLNLLPGRSVMATFTLGWAPRR